MEMGTGIAIAGVWMLPVACALSKTVTNAGFFIGVIVASILTYIFL